MPVTSSRRAVSFAGHCKMKFVFIILVLVGFVAVITASLHASCKIEWTWKTNCTTINEGIISQIKKWTGPDGCAHGGEKCNYKLTLSSPTLVKAVHMTPVKHYKDDLSFKFAASAGSCNVKGDVCSLVTPTFFDKGFSTSETWYAVLDSGTNYCNLHNLITGAGLDKVEGYKEDTDDSQCTQYSSHNCTKY